MKVDRVQKPELRAAALRHVGPYNEIGRAFAQLGAIAGPAGLFQHPGAAMIAIYHDAPGTTAPDKLQSDAAVVIPEGVAIPAGLTEQRVRAGRYASTVHEGSYETLGETWGRLMNEWIPANKLRMAPRESYEVYLNDPSQVRPEELRTEICVPVE